MYFTRAQMRALWFIIAVFAVTVIYHYLEYYLWNESPADFKAFEASFLRVRDSLLRADSADIPSPEGDLRQDDAAAHTVIIQQFPVNINRAGLEELQALPRIGPAMAARILDYRKQHGRFSAKTDLKKVKGIGPKTYEKLESLIVVE